MDLFTVLYFMKYDAVFRLIAFGNTLDIVAMLYSGAFLGSF